MSVGPAMTLEVEHKLDCPNPKRISYSKRGKSRWYGFYAGYSSEFVRYAIKTLNIPTDATIMDPWNGSGTTTQVANELGYSAIGFDANPIMIIVAKAKSINPECKNTILEKYNEIIEVASDPHFGHRMHLDPLETWFMPSSASVYRHIEQALEQVFVQNSPFDIEEPLLRVSNLVREISSEGAFYYTGLFTPLSKSLKPFWATNPTWIKTPTLDQRISRNAEQIYSAFKECILNMTKDLEEKPSIQVPKYPKLKLEVGSSQQMPISSTSIDAVISSPPYCTRIDYVIATKPELALLGYPMDEKLRLLRNSMIGTPTIFKKKLDNNNEWGITCNGFLRNVANHYLFSEDVPPTSTIQQAVGRI